MSFLSRLFKRESAARAETTSFAERYMRFKLFLSAYIKAYGEMMDFEERLADELPFGMPFLRVCTAKLTTASMQCALQLNAIGGNRFIRLNESFAVLRGEVHDILSMGAPLSPARSLCPTRKSATTTNLSSRRL